MSMSTNTINESDDRISSYTNVLTELRDNHDNFVAIDSESLSSKLDLVDNLQKAFKRDVLVAQDSLGHPEEDEVKLSATEACYDGKVYKVIASYGQQHAQAIAADMDKFDAVEFANKVRHAITGGEGDITEYNLMDFGQKCTKMIKHPPQWQILFGLLERGEVVRKPACERKKRVVDTETADKTRPEKLDSFKGASEDEATAAEVSHMFTTLRRLYKNNPEREVLFWEFVLDPTSYSRTTENLFHATFLVRDNRVSITGDDPVIRPLAKRPEGEDRSSVRRRQVCVNMNYTRWEELIAHFGRKPPMIQRK